MKPVARSAAAIVLGAIILIGAGGAGEAGGGICGSHAIAASTGVAVDVRENCYGPAVLSVQAGDTVRWTNGDPIAHTVTGVNAAWGNGELFAPGSTFVHRFTESGTYVYGCLLHPMMAGVVVVAEEETTGTQEVAASSADAARLTSEAGLKTEGGPRAPVRLVWAAVALGVAGGAAAAGGVAVLSSRRRQRL